MTGSLLQLVAIGNEDYFFVGNPQITFFKRVYLRHTNFSIERLELYNIGKRQLKNRNANIYNFNIDINYGDLLYYTVFHIKLPEIYADTNYQFRWIENLGSNIIDEASIYIGNTLIEKIDGSFLHINNILNLNNNSKTVYDASIKNMESVFNPCNDSKYPYSSVNSNYSNLSGYPIINKHYRELPTIDSQTLYIPLAFFFNRIKDLFIPITLMRETNIRITVKLKSIHDLYTIGYPTEITDGSGYKYYRHESFKQNSTKSISDFVKKPDFYLDCDTKLYYFVIFRKKYFVKKSD